ncbi:MAG: ferrous iron transport protein B [Bacilli bacterium]|nr:ferrous iron transport protein B [Bacilli bacterium]
MKIALLGNQNSGKTSLFNALTGSNQKIGNWPGVTIDRIEGKIKKHDATITDLPGVYSLSPYTSEEAISRHFVLEGKPDLIINIVDVTSLERSLYLTTQLLELNTDVIVVVNMIDLLEKKGIKINLKGLSEAMGVTMVPVSAKTGDGIDRLLNIIFRHKYKKNKHQKIYPYDVETFIQNVMMAQKCDRFAAVKVLEEDLEFRVLMNEETKKAHTDIENKYRMDGEQLVASLRYEYIEKLKKDFVQIKRRKITKSDRADSIFLHKIWAIPIFIVMMMGVYFLSIAVVGGLTSNLISAAFNGAKTLELDFIFTKVIFDHPVAGLGPLLGNWLKSVGASPWSVSLVVNGIVGGVSAVVCFVPQLMMLFLCLGILETTGYMSRIAFFLDRIFHKFGLSGKSLIPFIVGAGCSVPGVMSTRIIEDPNEKKATIALVPFVPCNAKLPIISLICSVFFGGYAFLFALLFYFMAIILILGSAIVLKKILKRKEHSTFISELPSYKAPDFLYIGRDVGDKTAAFFRRAGTVVVFFSVIVCILTSFTWDFKYVDNVSITVNQSMLAGIGNAFSWFFYPMLGGHGGEWMWVASVSSIQGLVAKEQVISSLRVIEAAGGPSIQQLFTPLGAFAYATFNLFSIPCVGTISTIHGELRSWKKTGLIMLCEIVVAWLLASFIGIWGALL